MNALFQHRYLIRQNLIMLIGLCLCVYFSYHAVQGSRSFARLISLDSKIATLSLEKRDLDQKKEKIQQKVAMMRPGSLNRDLLEERARLILGYQHKDDLAVVGK